VVPLGFYSQWEKVEKSTFAWNLNHVNFDPHWVL